MTLLSYVYPTNNHTNGKTQIIILISPQKGLKSHSSWIDVFYLYNFYVKMISY